MRAESAVSGGAEPGPKKAAASPQEDDGDSDNDWSRGGKPSKGKKGGKAKKGASILVSFAGLGYKEPSTRMLSDEQKGRASVLWLHLGLLTLCSYIRRTYRISGGLRQ